MKSSTDRASRDYPTWKPQSARERTMIRLHEIDRNRFELREDHADEIGLQSAALKFSLQEISAKNLEIANQESRNSESIRTIDEMSRVIEELTRRNAVLDQSMHELRDQLEATQDEVVRYQTLVEGIFKSHRWRIGNFLFTLKPTNRKFTYKDERSKSVGAVAAHGALAPSAPCHVGPVFPEQELQFDLLEPIGTANLKRLQWLCRELEQDLEREFESRMDQIGDRLGSALLEGTLLGIGRKYARE